jgi:hypothetical protein
MSTEPSPAMSDESVDAVEPIQRGFPGHFIAVRNCCFRLCHDVGTVRVSTVGCYHPAHAVTDEPEEIGLGRTFETYVFRLTDALNDYGLPEIDASEIDSEGYMSWQDAEAGHASMVAKYAANGGRP